MKKIFFHILLHILRILFQSFQIVLIRPNKKYSSKEAKFVLEHAEFYADYRSTAKITKSMQKKIMSKIVN